MKRKIYISLLIIGVIVFIISFVKATGETKFNSIEQAEQYIKQNIDNIDITDAIKICNRL